MTLLRIAMIGVAGPIAEEMAYRGAMLYALEVRAGLSAAVAIVLASIVWTASHLQYDVTTMGMIFLDGLLLGAAPVLDLFRTAAAPAADGDVQRSRGPAARRVLNTRCHGATLRRYPRCPGCGLALKRQVV